MLKDDDDCSSIQTSTSASSLRLPPHLAKALAEIEAESANTAKANVKHVPVDENKTKVRWHVVHRRVTWC